MQEKAKKALRNQKRPCIPPCRKDQGGLNAYITIQLKKQ